MSGLKYNNEYEIRVWGLKRSGNHAIINWIASLFDKPVYFFNNCGIYPEKTDVKFCKSTFGRGEELCKDYYVEGRRFGKEKDKIINDTHDKYLIYSFENQDIKMSDSITHWAGESKHKFDVIVLRDIWNWMASYVSINNKNCRLRVSLDEYNPEFKDDPYAKNINGLCFLEVKYLYDMWYEYANEFLSNTNYLGYKLVPISFNRWFVDEKYRENLALMFNLKNNDNTLRHISFPGSSFIDGTWDARKLDVLERWRNFEHSSAFWTQLLNHSDATNLSKRIFGRLKRSKE